MKKVLLLIGYIVIILGYFLNQAVYAEDRKEYVARIRLFISAPDDIKNQAYSYLTREIRALSDVQIVEKEADWKISIVVMKSPYGNMWIFSTLILGAFDVDLYFLPFMQMKGPIGVIVRNTMESIPEKDKAVCNSFSSRQIEYIKFITSEYYRYENHIVRTAGINDLEWLCKTIIADFDVKFLMEKRR